MLFSQSSVASNWSDAPAFMGAKTSKVMNDPVHGHMLMDRLCLDIMDTPQFQRLRDLRQLGSAYFVFPGASHNRFEHSVGTCHLAGELLSRFRIQQPELDITDLELQLVRVAGLCHDLGHGPFSHVFDNEFIPRALPGCKWSHEDMSLDLLEHLIDDNNIDIETADVRFIKDVIIGSKRSVHTSRSFLYEIVANGRNSIDVDKFDYLARDTYNLGLKSSYDSSRLMGFSRVIGEEICYHSKEVFNVYEMYHTRYSLFKQIYSHRAAKGIEYMITDALLEADSVFKFSSAIDDPKRYWKLTDCVLRDIEFSDHPELEKARRIIRNIRKRRLYRLADEQILPIGLGSKLKKVTAVDIAACNVTAGVRLRPADIVVHDLKLNYTNKDKNPVDNVRFFKAWDDTESFSINKDDVSYLLPAKFQERIVRAYCKSSKQSKLEATQAAFREFLRKCGLGKKEANPSSRVWASPDKRDRSESPDITPGDPTPPPFDATGGIAFGAGDGAGAGSRRALWKPDETSKKIKASLEPKGAMDRFVKRQRLQ